MKHKCLIISTLAVTMLISIFIQFKPIYAFNDLDNYTDGNISPSDINDVIGSSIVSWLLTTGAEIVAPGSGQTVQALYDDINAVLDEATDIKEHLVTWLQDKAIRLQNPEYLLPWHWDSTLSYDYNPVQNAAQFYLEHRSTDSPSYNPDVNYLPYIELINGTGFNYSYYLTDNWVSTLTTSTDHVSGFYLISDPSNYSYFAKNYTANLQWNNSGYAESYYVAKMGSNNRYSLNESYTLEHVSLYINQVGNTYQVTTSSIIPKALLHGNSYGDSYTCGLSYDRQQNKIMSFTGRTTSMPNNVTFQYSANSLEACFQMIAMRWRNVNIYVNGDPWSIVTSPPDPIEIGGNTYLTNTNLPVDFQFPEGTLNDLGLIKSILHQLIDLNSTGTAITIQIDDILEAFTDENGQQAMYVIVIHRNDYDVLIQEQYPYKTVPGENNYVLARDSILESYNNQAKYIVKNMGTDAIPSDILRILGAAGALLLVAYLINRMLE